MTTSWRSPTFLRVAPVGWSSTTWCCAPGPAGRRSGRGTFPSNPRPRARGSPASPPATRIRAAIGSRRDCRSRCTAAGSCCTTRPARPRKRGCSSCSARTHPPPGAPGWPTTSRTGCPRCSTGSGRSWRSGAVGTGPRAAVRHRRRRRDRPVVRRRRHRRASAHRTSRGRTGPPQTPAPGRSSGRRPTQDRRTAPRTTREPTPAVGPPRHRPRGRNHVTAPGGRRGRRPRRAAELAPDRRPGLRPADLRPSRLNPFAPERAR